MSYLEKAEHLVRNHPANKDLMVSMDDPIEGTMGGYFEPAHLEHYLRVLGDSKKWFNVGITAEGKD